MTFLTVTLGDRGQPGLLMRVSSRFVLAPSPLSCLLAENLDIRRDAIVADVGCGCGLLAIVAAKCGAKLVYALDVNPHALGDTAFNAEVNGVSSIVRPVMFDIRSTRGTLRGKVDVVVSNPPQTPTVYQTARGKWLTISRDGGASGRVMLDYVIARSPDLFRAGERPPRLEIVTSSLLGIGATLDNLRRHGFSPSVVASSLIPITIPGGDPAGKTKHGQSSYLSYERSVVVHAVYNRPGRSHTRRK